MGVMEDSEDCWKRSSKVHLAQTKFFQRIVSVAVGRVKMFLFSICTLSVQMTDAVLAELVVDLMAVDVMAPSAHKRKPFLQLY